MAIQIRRTMTIALAGIAAAGVLAAARPAHAGPVLLQPFAADSGDQCRYGSTSGTLGWQLSSTAPPSEDLVIYVNGTLTDKPTTSSGTACQDDGMHSRANFLAYSRTTIVDSEVVRADNESVSFAFSLAHGSSNPDPIDRVVVQVCRFPNSPFGISYCGPAQEYRRPYSTN